MDDLLDPAPALVERIAGQPHDVKGVLLADQARSWRVTW
jgi:hypothetical protein